MVIKVELEDETAIVFWPLQHIKLSCDANEIPTFNLNL